LSLEELSALQNARCSTQGIIFIWYLVSLDNFMLWFYFDEIFI
jgi:hypothetical protein